jgi:hypothetical protein
VVEEDTNAIDPMDIRVGDHAIFGSYEQDNNLRNGAEPIEWLVLDRQGDDVLLLSLYALDCQMYNDKSENTTWPYSSIRYWLNRDFLNSAFDSDDQARIRTTLVKAHKNPDYRQIDQGNDSSDKVFLLSVKEADAYLSSDAARKCLPTPYALRHGAYEGGNDGTTHWWLRTIGHYSKTATSVDGGGRINEFGSSVTRDSMAVRPAIWVSLNH